MQTYLVTLEAQVTGNDPQDARQHLIEALDAFLRKDDPRISGTEILVDDEPVE